MVGTDIKTSLKNAVNAAMAEKDPEKADQKYVDVLQLVRLQVGDNETDLANAFQAIAKDLEAEGRKQDAFDFKQKTCILLLEWTMNPLPPLPKDLALSVTLSGVEEPLFKQAFTIHYVSDLGLARKHYEMTQQAIILDQHQDNIYMRTAAGALLLLLQGERGEYIPAYESPRKEEAREFLDKHGWANHGKNIVVKTGTIALYAHEKLGRLALIQ